MVFDRTAYNHQYWLDHKDELVDIHKKASEKFWNKIKKDPKKHEEYLKKQREYNQKPERVKQKAEYFQKIYPKKKKERLAYGKKYIKEHGEQHRDYRNVHHHKNAERLNKQRGVRYKKNPEYLAYFQQYALDYPNRIRAYSRTKALGLRRDSCEDCGSKESLVFHREGSYDFDVNGKTVCRLCLHRNYLSKKKKIKW